MVGMSDWSAKRLNRNRWLGAQQACAVCAKLVAMCECIKLAHCLLTGDFEPMSAGHHHLGTSIGIFKRPPQTGALAGACAQLRDSDS